MKPYLILALAFAAISLITFFLYGIDKQRAKRHAWRIKESVLLSFTFFGGAAGAILGMGIFHHKTRHWYFRMAAVIGILWQTALCLYIAWR